MRQIITFIIVVVATLIARANYTTLSFKTLSGETHSLDITGLEISFSEENLIASDTKNNICIPLAQMASMEFSDMTTGDINCITVDKLNGTTSVYTINGAEVGIYTSFSEAMSNISTGIFIFKFADGTTLKITKK